MTTIAAPERPTPNAASGGGPEGPPPRAPTDGPATLREALPILLSHPSPRLLIAIIAVCAALRITVGPFTWWDLVPAVVLVTLWPVLEWLIHVLLLHHRPRRIGRFTIDFYVSQKHRRHHRDPWNYEILFLPYRSFLIGLPLALLVWFGLAPTPALAMTGVTLHFVMSLHYEVVHFLIHTRVTPRTAYYQRVWRNHRLHHFRNEHYWFDVSVLGGDRLLGTCPPPETTPISDTARALPTA